ncbi:MAG: hypothetical protein QN163_05875 [Armatimonadota bacterium]|nr:hypothetical protein [Armatimonadota bacterium]
MQHRRSWRVVLAASAVLMIASAGYGGPSATGSQTATVIVQQAITLSIASPTLSITVAPDECGTVNSGALTVRSNVSYNLNLRANPTANPNARPRSGTTDMTNVFQWRTTSPTTGAWTDITTSYVLAYSGTSTGAAGRSHDVDYRQCATFDDAPGDYTIQIDWQAVGNP